MTIKIVETNYQDLDNVMNLWSNGEVMKYVGFPNGLIRTKEQMNEWLIKMKQSKPKRNHYSIYENDIYCGETYYGINQENMVATLDIKLLPTSRGKGIATISLKFAVEQAFKNGAVKCYVDPNPLNLKAIELYKRIGMIQKEMPEELKDPNYPNYLYFEISK